LKYEMGSTADEFQIGLSVSPKGILLLYTTIFA